jgi:hypothetical protein
MATMRDDEQQKLEPHAGRKTTFGVTAIILITAAIIVIGGILAIWVL